MRITVDSVLALNPCSGWRRKRIEAWFAGRKYALASTALRDDAIPRDDRLWLGISLMDKRQQRLFSCDCAERALNRERARGREPGERSWNALVVARRFANGEATREELAAARDAAWDAARDAARAATWDAAWAAETDWQIAHAIEVLGG